MKNLQKVLLSTWAELSPGVYLWASKILLEEQEEWGDLDESKHKDFSTAPYWVTTDDGHEESFNSIEEALELYEIGVTNG